MSFVSVLRLFSAPLVVVSIIACSGVDESTRIEYQKLADIKSEETRSREFQRQSPGMQVDLYLYGVEQQFPSDYTLAPYFQSEKAAEILVGRLAKAQNGKQVFGIVYALHGIYKGGNGGERIGALANAACDRFYSSPSPCHQLAAQIRG